MALGSASIALVTPKILPVITLMSANASTAANAPPARYATIAIGTILGYSAMAGTVGGGGLGDIAIRYGYHRYQVDIMVVTVILLIVLVQIFQTIGMHIANKIDRRKR